MKLLVETTGDFQLVHNEQHEHVRATGYSVIEKSQWATGRVSIGQLLVEAQLNDEATDEEWRETLRDTLGDETDPEARAELAETAKASFIDRFRVDAESARKEEPPARDQTTEQVEHNVPSRLPAGAAQTGKPRAKH